MDKIKFDQLLEASNAYYQGKPYTMSDEVYDALRAEALTHCIKILDYVDFGDEIRHEHRNQVALQKRQVRGDFSDSVSTIIAELNKDCRLYPKLDGTSIVIYYKNGQLEKILTKHTEEHGICRTKKLMNMVPQLVDPSIDSIQCEAIVDMKAGFGELARNKANGLIGSKYMQDEVEQLIHLKAFNINFVDGEYQYNRLIQSLDNLPNIYFQKEGSTRICFSKADVITTDLINKNSFLSHTGEDILIDGVVLYHTEGIQGLKFYFTEFADTIVTDIAWNYTPDKESYTPVAWFEEVVLNDAHIIKSSIGGVSRMEEMRIGKGAKVKVIRANMTIPRIEEVYEGSDDFQWPVCCGKELNHSDEQFGSVMKCINPNCDKKYNARIADLENDTDYNSATNKLELSEKILQFFDHALGAMLRIDRFAPGNFKESKEVLCPLFIESLETRDFDKYKMVIERAYNFSELQQRLVLINTPSTFKAWCEFYNRL